MSDVLYLLNSVSVKFITGKTNKMTKVCLNG